MRNKTLILAVMKVNQGLWLEQNKSIFRGLPVFLGSDRGYICFQVCYNNKVQAADTSLLAAGSFTFALAVCPIEFE